MWNWGYSDSLHIKKETWGFLLSVGFDNTRKHSRIPQMIITFGFSFCF